MADIIIPPSMMRVRARKFFSNVSDSDTEDLEVSSEQQSQHFFSFPQRFLKVFNCPCFWSFEIPPDAFKLCFPKQKF
ncbi:hypothetical protein CEXT_46651 [Caerostris extrusa]|uniref:Uncharacterized protein n=1 Tax=Caerostris extrusa TaxID=172846 RepID=A0AAV4XHV3_CAEEX|nr:hypothetical protein CEXT_46651 [Caerostris extrusa]